MGSRDAISLYCRGLQRYIRNEEATTAEQLFHISSGHVPDTVYRHTGREDQDFTAKSLRM